MSLRSAAIPDDKAAESCRYIFMEEESVERSGLLRARCFPIISITAMKDRTKILARKTIPAARDELFL
ncbi:MAG: hypothetical protein IKE62_01750 [Oscillospiraceae bacterium]|nr:hypothetical protein [Oscillospiraceae bacterium]